MYLFIYVRLPGKNTNLSFKVVSKAIRVCVHHHHYHHYHHYRDDHDHRSIGTVFHHECMRDILCCPTVLFVIPANFHFYPRALCVYVRVQKVLRKLQNLKTKTILRAGTVRKSLNVANLVTCVAATTSRMQDPTSQRRLSCLQPCIPWNWTSSELIPGSDCWFAR